MGRVINIKISLASYMSLAKTLGGGEAQWARNQKNVQKIQVFIGIQQTQLYLRADDNSFTSQKFQILDFPGFREDHL